MSAADAPTPPERRRPSLWLPERTSATEGERFGSLADVRLFPPAGRVQAGETADMLVGAYDVRRALEVAGQLKGLKVFQAFSAGVDSNTSTHSVRAPGGKNP